MEAFGGAMAWSLARICANSQIFNVKEHTCHAGLNPASMTP
jgi:hypothetical protein